MDASSILVFVTFVGSMFIVGDLARGADPVAGDDGSAAPYSTPASCGVN